MTRELFLVLAAIAATLTVVFALTVGVTIHYMSLEPSEYTCVKKTNP